MTDAPGNTQADSLTIVDNRTGSSYDVPITDGTVKASEFSKIKVNEEDPGIALYDPGFTNTASCRSSVTFINRVHKFI